MTDLHGNVIATMNTPDNWESADQYERIEQSISAFKCSVTLGIPDSYFSQLIAPQRNLILMYSIIIAFAGLIIASAIAYHSAMPIRKLVAGLQLNMGKDKYEYSVIEGAFNSLNQSHDQLVEATEGLERSLCQSRFGQLLFGSSFSISHKQDFIIALPKLSAVHCVAVIRIDYSGKQNDEDANELILTSISQSLNEFEPVYPLSHSMLAILIRSDELELLTKRINEINERLNASIDAYVTAGVSQPDTDINTTARQFVQAMDNLSRVTDEKTVVANHSQRNLIESIPLFEGMRRTYALLLTGARERIAEQLHDAYMNMKAGAVTSQQKKQLYYCIEMMLSSACHEHGLCDEEFSLPAYVETSSLEELFRSFEQAVDDLCINLNRRRMCGNTDLKEYILKFIDENYHNPDLYANVIADESKISVKYLHKVFREYTGRSVCDYIEERRMQHARELLKDDQVNVSTISDVCGFRSLNTFYKAFKRIHGVSPTDYRKLLIEYRTE
jgi:AraC-like DNA-binding protein